jgi:hypothetical protein
MSDFERYAVQRVLDQAAELGVPAPTELSNFVCGTAGSHAARAWADAHPEDESVRGCCEGEAYYGPDRCTCWQPVYDVEQLPPRPPKSADDIEVQHSMCGDCAFRPDSPERADEWLAESLMSLAEKGTPFWCHDGMRRPVLWRHPDGREIPGDPADYQPAMVGPVPFRADGRSGLLCAGWMARAARVATRA